MNWIKVSTTIGDDPRIGRIADACESSTNEVLGAVVRILGKLSEHAADGDISNLPTSMLEQWGGWRGEPGLFGAAFRAELCNEHGVVRAWEKWNGAAQRQLSAARQRAANARQEKREPFADSSQIVRETFAERSPNVREKFAAKKESKSKREKNYSPQQEEVDTPPACAREEDPPPPPFSAEAGGASAKNPPAFGQNGGATPRSPRGHPRGAPRLIEPLSGAPGGAVIPPEVLAWVAPRGHDALQCLLAATPEPTAWVGILRGIASGLSTDQQRPCDAERLAVAIEDFVAKGKHREPGGPSPKLFRSFVRVARAPIRQYADQQTEAEHRAERLCTIRRQNDLQRRLGKPERPLPEWAAEIDAMFPDGRTFPAEGAA